MDHGSIQLLPRFRAVTLSQFRIDQDRVGIVAIAHDVYSTIPYRFLGICLRMRYRPPRACIRRPLSGPPGPLRRTKPLCTSKIPARGGATGGQHIGRRTIPPPVPQSPLKVADEVPRTGAARLGILKPLPRPIDGISQPRPRRLVVVRIRRRGGRCLRVRWRGGGCSRIRPITHPIPAERIFLIIEIDKADRRLWRPRKRLEGACPQLVLYRIGAVFPAQTSPADAIVFG